LEEFGDGGIGNGDGIESETGECEIGEEGLMDVRGKKRGLESRKLIFKIAKKKSECGLFN
jgi:hypothetical protein